MKQLAFLMMLALAAPAWAQAEQEPAKKEPAKKEAVKPSAEAPKKHAAASPRTPGRRWHEDARHCLERPTNTEVIKCAEEYL
jgi:hypothetical protein